MKNSPVLIGVINAIIPGVGYVILKERVVFGWLLIASVLFYIPFALLEPSANHFFLSQSSVGKFFESLTYIVATFAFGYDAYDIASKRAKSTTEVDTPVA